MSSVQQHDDANVNFDNLQESGQCCRHSDRTKMIK